MSFKVTTKRNRSGRLAMGARYQSANRFGLGLCVLFLCIGRWVAHLINGLLRYFFV